MIVVGELLMRNLLKVVLTAHGYKVEESETSQDEITQATASYPDMIILDLSLPGMSGIELVKHIRERTRAPMIVLAVREQEKVKIAALDAGADDYVTTPFDIGELLGRIRTLLRYRADFRDELVLTFDDLVIDLSRRQVAVDGNEVELTPVEYELLRLLAVNIGKVLTRRQMMRMICDYTNEKDADYLHVCIRQLREKIERGPVLPRHIITEPGVGYRFI